MAHWFDGTEETNRPPLKSTAYDRTEIVRQLREHAGYADRTVSADWIREAQRLLRAAAEALAPGERGTCAWTLLKDEHPKPHARYIVRRDGFVFTATSCYGMHPTWWVVKTLTGEAPPEKMLDTDEWQALHQPREGEGQ